MATLYYHIHKTIFEFRKIKKNSCLTDPIQVENKSYTIPEPQRFINITFIENAQ